MRYDLRMTIDYAYAGRADGARHLLRMTPPSIADEQVAITSLLSVEPQPTEWRNRVDFFGNPVVEVAFHEPVEETRFTIEARVERLSRGRLLDVSSRLPDLERELQGWRDLGPEAPHHFRAASARVPLTPELADYGRGAMLRAQTVWEAVEMLGRAIHADMRYDPDATEVDTPVMTAFEGRHGVCQDFSHIMIGALRGMGIPAGYVSGFLRTTPPPGRPRLEGADAMHAWVRAWCGREMGWREYDPTNAMSVGTDHVVVARGRDYSDVAPIKGVMRIAGGQSVRQAVDVIPLD